MAMASVLGCPVTAVIALESACAVTNVPTCATATPSTAWGADCCSSIYAYGSNVAACFVKNAPACLDTSAAAATLAAQTGGNVCAPYLGGGGGGAATAPATTAAGATATSGTGTTSSPSAAASAKSAAAPKMRVGLKVYLGVALVGSLAVLSL